MEDEDESSSRSHSPSSSSSLPYPQPISTSHPSYSTPANAQPSNPVTIASSFPQILTLALPIQPSLGSAASAGAGREDCWSEGATSALIDAWGDRYLDLNRGNLKQKQWQEVADVVSSREDYSKTPKTDAQCKNRIDTLKKKYKVEKLKMASSSWPFFHRMDLLFGPSLKPSPPVTTIPKKQRTNLLVKRKASTPPASPSSTSDRSPPATNGWTRHLRADRKKELAQAIRRFGEVYQRVESASLQLSMEMERQRMEFSMELERQRIQFFTKTQMELSSLKRLRTSSRSGGGRNSQNRQRHGHQTPANRDNDDNENYGSGYM